VLQNFLANAVRYTPRGGIVLGVRRSGGQLRIEVHDTGTGIAPDQQAVIFEEFRRGQDAAGQGLGLGLAIADRIARLLDAPLTLRSQPGVGTVFAVMVERVPTPSQAAKAGRATALAGLDVLVVDNEALALDALVQVLRGWGCHVNPANDTHTAQAALERQAADLWLLDYHLDDGDTGVALHQCLSETHGPRPTLVLSADAGETVRRAVHEAGLPLLLKPVKPLALKSVLDRLLAARRVE
jgi:CheY-like chemotaxis protein